MVSMAVLGGTNGPTLLGNKQVGGGGQLRVNKEHEHLTPHIESTSTLHLTQRAQAPYTLDREHEHLTPYTDSISTLHLTPHILHLTRIALATYTSLLS